MVAGQQNNNEELPDQAEPVAETTADAAGEQPAAPETDQAEANTLQIEILEKQVQDNLDRALRAQAELDNVRKRAVRDVENAHRYALDKFASELLPVLDSMEMGISAAETAEDTDSLVQGMALTQKMFRDTLEKFGIVEVETEGQKFDPERHEAVSMQESEGAESGQIVTVLQKGYSLNGRLIRPAMVVVAK